MKTSVGKKIISTTPFKNENLLRKEDSLVIEHADEQPFDEKPQNSIMIYKLELALQKITWSYAPPSKLHNDIKQYYKATNKIHEDWQAWHRADLPDHHNIKEITVSHNTILDVP